MLGVHGERRTEEAVGRYRVVSQLGQGGTADVHLAVADGPAGFQKLVVLKVLKKSLASDPEFRDMFLNEARLAARLHHPNIVQTNEVLEIDGAPVMVMEYLEGQPLSQVIVRGRAAGFSLAMQLRVLVDALQGLHAAHELADTDGTPLGVVHRDVSPHNLFVTFEGQAKVLDFGIAKLERSMVETEIGTIKGKLRYMAPEQVAGERLDRRADVYAAGVILWEALVGERMWKGCLEGEIRTRVQRGDLQMPGAVRADVSPALDQICRRALALSPAERYPTALALAEALEAALPDVGRPASAREIGATVAKLFEDVRAETRGAIEGKLARISGQMPASSAMATAEFAVDPAVVSAPPIEVTQTPVRAATPAPAAETRARRRSLALMVAGATTLAIAVGIVVGLLSGRAPAPAAAVEAPRPASPPPGPPAPPAVAAPAPLPSAPVVPATAEAPRRDDPRPAVRPAAKRRPAAPAAGAGAPAKGAAARDCDPPFFFDVDGIKRFRPECM